MPQSQREGNSAIDSRAQDEEREAKNCLENRVERQAGKSVNTARGNYDILRGVSGLGATATGNRSGAVPRPSREKPANGMPRSHHDMLRETELTALN